MLNHIIQNNDTNNLIKYKENINENNNENIILEPIIIKKKVIQPIIIKKQEIKPIFDELIKNIQLHEENIKKHYEYINKIYRELDKLKDIIQKLDKNK